MRIRTRLLATIVVVIGLLVPAAVARAAPPAYTVKVDAALTTVYPARDGYRDTVQLTGSITGTADRVRGSLILSLGKRVVQVWPVPGPGQIAVTWDGRIRDQVVAGRYTVQLRATGSDGVTIRAVDTLVVSKKKLVQVTTRWSHPFVGDHACYDDTFTFPDAKAALRYERSICRQNNKPSGYGPINVTIRGKISQGPVRYVGLEYDRVPKEARRDTYGPTQMSVTGTFVQSGAGSNEFYVCAESPCSPGSGSVVFAKSGTFTTPKVTLRTSTPREPHFMVVVQPGHDLLVKKYTVTVTYWILK